MKVLWFLIINNLENKLFTGRAKARPVLLERIPKKEEVISPFPWGYRLEKLLKFFLCVKDVYCSSAFKLKKNWAVFAINPKGRLTWLQTNPFFWSIGFVFQDQIACYDLDRSSIQNYSFFPLVSKYRHHTPSCSLLGNWL